MIVGWEELFDRGKVPADLRGTPAQLAAIQMERATREQIKAERLQKEAQVKADKKEACKAAIARQKAAVILPQSALYVLRDPNTGDVRYVGQSTNPNVRLKWHVLKPGKSTRAWVESLGDRHPVMQILAWYSFDSVIAAENQCIALCLEHGIALLNSAFEIDRGRRHPLGK